MNEALPYIMLTKKEDYIYEKKKLLTNVTNKTFINIIFCALQC